MCGRFGETDIVYALLQIERNGVAYHREILIVNRESRLAGEKQRRERDADQHGSRGPWPRNECSNSFHVAELNTRRAKNDDEFSGNAAQLFPPLLSCRAEGETSLIFPANG